MDTNPLTNFFHKYIIRRPYKGPVKDFTLLMCDIAGDSEIGSVSITTRSLKHLFDKKPAEEFHFLLDYIHLIMIYPDKIYKNKDGKRGSLCFEKRVKGCEYICAIERISPTEFQIATAFRLRDPDYIKNYTLLWNRGSGKPHRHALEFPK